MAKEKKKVPDLRFKGFTNDWEQRKLGDITEKVTEKNKDNRFSETLTNSAEHGIVSQRDFFDKDISNSKKLSGYYVVHPDDFVYNPRISNTAPVGPIKRNRLGRTGVMSPLYYVFQVHDVNKNYLEKYFLTTNWNRFMKLNGDSGARADRFSIKASVFKQMPIPVPISRDEQEKIGEFLDQFDSLIALHQRKLVLLKQLKKGLLQKMFADKDSKRPVLRFEGFNDDWERWKLGDLVVIKSGLSTNTQSRQGFYKITRIETISKGLIDMNKTGSVQIKPDDKYLMHAGDILFSNINSLKHIGKVAIFNGKSTLYHGMNLLRMTAQSNVSSYFIYYQLITDKHSNWAKAHANPAVSQASINQHTLSLEPMYITKLEEQHEISDFIGKLDSILTFQQQKLVRINKIKKSLLQQIFI